MSHEKTPKQTSQPNTQASAREDVQPQSASPSLPALMQHIHHAPRVQRTQAILNLQRTIGNTATQRALNRAALQGQQGRAGRGVMQGSMLTSGLTLQRHLGFGVRDLKGKEDTKGITNAISSTFNAIQTALAKFHMTARDDYKNLQEHLTTMIEKCDAWLGNVAHLKTSDLEKEASLKRLREAAWLERKRVIITKEIGVPYQLMDGLGKPAVDNLFEIVLVLTEEKNSKKALALFAAHKGHLGSAAVLIKQFMIQNHMQVFNPTVAQGQQKPGSQNIPKDGGEAKALIIAEAQAKLARYATLQALYNTQQADYQASQDPNKNLANYPLLDASKGEGLELGLLKARKPQFEGIIDGTIIAQKKKEEGLGKLTEAELYGIVGYTSDLFSTINTGMRNDIGTGQFKQGNEQLAGAMTAGLKKLERHKGRVFRHNGDFPGFKEVNLQDATVVEIAPTSTAVSQAACASAGTQHAVLEIFESIKGRDVSKASVFGGGEQEVLFAPGTRFKVVAVFARKPSAWGQPHDPTQYHSPVPPGQKGQQHHPLFAEAMTLVAADAKKDLFHRVIFKHEIK